MNYKISIIIPVFNVENYVREALDSIANQTIGLENLEVIMVDDCSTDQSGRILDEYATKYESFKVIHLPQNSGGPGKPRNIGIENATGDYLIFFDPDDIYDNDILNTLHQKIILEDVDLVFCNFHYLYPIMIRKKGIKFDNSHEIKLKTIDDYPQLLKMHPSLWVKLYKRSFIQEKNLKFGEDILSEDRVFVLNAFLEAHGIIYLQNYYGLTYRIHDPQQQNSISNAISKNHLIKRIKGYAESFHILKEYGKAIYFPYIFSNIREFWANAFVLSNLRPDERKELLRRISFLFEEFKKYDVNINPSKKYLVPLFTQIENQRFEEAVEISEVLKQFLVKNQELEEEKAQLKSANQRLKQQLKDEKKQLSEYLTTYGFIRYKSKNIASRIRNRVNLR